MLCSQSDVSHDLHTMSVYWSDPGDGHLVVVNNILNYLRRTKGLFLVYGGQKVLDVIGYTSGSF